MTETVKTMAQCCPDKVDELIKNNANFNDEHKESLLAMTEDGFATVIDVSKNLKIVDNADDLVEKDDVVDNKDEKTITMEDLPPEMQESVNYGNKVLAQNKAAKIALIKTNKTNSFSDAELEKFDIDMLTKLASMAPATAVNYAANGGGGNPAETVDVEPLPTTNSWEDDVKTEKK